MNQQQAQERILRPHDVTELTGLQALTLAREVRRGRFPAPIKISPRRRGWLLSEITAWIEARAAERDARQENQD